MFDLLLYLVIVFFTIAVICVVIEWKSFLEHVKFLKLSTTDKIIQLSQRLEKESSVLQQEILLANIKKYAEKYKEEQEQIVHPTKSRWETIVDEKTYKPFFRGAMLFSFAIATIATVSFSPEIISDFINNIKSTFKIADDDKSFSTIVIFLLTSPFAFLVWYYRDMNNYRELELTHRDTLFSEHKQLVEWATKEAEVKKEDEKQKDQAEQKSPIIQVAAIYQLAPFLKDHHANLYQRSTLETLRAIVNASRPEWEKWVTDYEDWIKKDKDKRGIEPVKPELSGAVKAVHAVLREHPALFYHEKFNAEDFNLAGFDGSGLNLSGCNFQKTLLVGSNFSFATLNYCNFYKAKLLCVNFERSKLIGVSFSYGSSIKTHKIDTDILKVNDLTSSDREFKH